jgi:hypothetical protein
LTFTEIFFGATLATLGMIICSTPWLPWALMPSASVPSGRLKRRRKRPVRRSVRV